MKTIYDIDLPDAMKMINTLQSLDSYYQIICKLAAHGHSKEEIAKILYMSVEDIERAKDDIIKHFEEHGYKMNDGVSFFEK